MIYPTIRYDANAENFALRPMSVDKYLFVDKVEYIEITRVRESFYEYKIIDYSDSFKNDMILWKELKHTWTMNTNSKDIYFVEEDDKAIAYDEAGNLIPHD